MLLFPSMAQEERIGNRWVKEKETPRHVLNRKADKKLDFVADLFSNLLGDRLTDRKSDLLRKRLYFRGFHYISYLNLSYPYENRLWAFSYNLDYRTSIDAPDSQKELGFCSFAVKNSGKKGIENAVWYDNGSLCSLEESNYFLKMLNNKLITDRIVSLDMTKIQITYHPGARQWRFSCRTLIGSTTWILIPPVMSLIKPKVEECARLLEFFELTADAVINV